MVDAAVNIKRKSSFFKICIVIIGDEDIFGEQTIVEASDEGDEVAEDNMDGSGRGPSANFFETNRIVVNVFFWPGVRFVYGPAYRPWASPWKWRHYPNYWRPWRPYAWHVFHPRRVYYHRHYAVVRTHRVVAAHRIYTPYRVSSVTVRTRTTFARNNYKVTRTTKRTVVTGPRGNTQVRKTQNTRVQRRGAAVQGNNADAIEDRKEKRKKRRG